LCGGWDAITLRGVCQKEKGFQGTVESKGTLEHRTTKGGREKKGKEGEKGYEKDETKSQIEQ
jgi:hypothetical protein